MTTGLEIIDHEGVLKVSCSRTELKRCSDTKRRWNRNDDGRFSPE